MINYFLSQDEACTHHRNSQASKLFKEKIIKSKKTISKLAFEYKIDQTKLSVMQNGYNFYYSEFEELCKPDKFNISNDDKNLILKNDIEAENDGAYLHAVNNAHTQIAKYLNIGVYHNCIYKRIDDYPNYISYLYMILINNLVYIPTWTSRQKRPDHYITDEIKINKEITKFLEDSFETEGPINLRNFHFEFFSQLSSFELNDKNEEILLNIPNKKDILNSLPSVNEFDAAEKFAIYLRQIPDNLSTIAKWLDISEGHLEKLYYKSRIPSKETKTEIILNPKFSNIISLKADEITQFISGNEQLRLNYIIKQVNHNMSLNLPKYNIQGIDTLISVDINEFNNKYLYEANGKSVDLGYVLLLAKMINFSCYDKMMKDNDYALKILKSINDFNSNLLKEHRQSINYSFKEIIKPKNNLYSFDNSLIVDTKLLKKLSK